MRKEFNYYDFKKFADKRLHRLKEERLSQYQKYVEAHFGRLMEDKTEDLFHIGKHYGLNEERLAVDEDVLYNNVEYKYFIHDDVQYIALDKDLKVVDTGDFDVESLSSMKVIGEDADDEIDKLKDQIYTQREQRALDNMKYKTSDPAKYEQLEKKATDDFIKQLRDLKKLKG